MKQLYHIGEDDKVFTLLLHSSWVSTAIHVVGHPSMQHLRELLGGPENKKVTCYSYP